MSRFQDTLLSLSKPAVTLPPQRWSQRGRRWLVLLSLSILSACSASEAQSVRSKGDQRPVPVTIATVARKTMPILVKATGTVQAYSTVSVKSQVEGELIGVYFTEGQEIHKGDLLFKIDPRPLQATLNQAIANRAKTLAQVSQASAALLQAQAQVHQAQANVLKDQAIAKNARAQAERYAILLREGAIAQEQADQFRTTAESQQATVIADQSQVANAIAAVSAAKANVQNAQADVNAANAAVENARVQLSYSSIFAPINGKASSLRVNQGNLVNNNDTNPLVVISQTRPIYVTFSIPQKLLPDLQKYQARGKLTVKASPPNSSDSAVTGELAFVDSTVDTSTGTIQLKASFSNDEGRLTPGQFVNVVMQLTQEPNAIVVPSKAIQTGQKGSFVYVVKSDHTVEARNVIPGATVNRFTIIQKGLQPGEQVVTDGQFNLTPGAKIASKDKNHSRFNSTRR